MKAKKIVQSEKLLDEEVIILFTSGFTLYISYREYFFYIQFHTDALTVIQQFPSKIGFRSIVILCKTTIA